MMSTRMMGAAPSAAAAEMSVLRALARLLDPESDKEIARLAAEMPREDVRRAIEGLHELICWIRELTPLEDTITRAIEDLQQCEAALAEREAKLLKREEHAARVDRALNDFTESLQT
jgi:hypothetical protein